MHIPLAARCSASGKLGEATAVILVLSSIQCTANEVPHRLILEPAATAVSADCLGAQTISITLHLKMRLPLFRKNGAIDFNCKHC